jgi:hypothetical protein
MGHWASFLKLKKLVIPTGFSREESAVFEEEKQISRE